MNDVIFAGFPHVRASPQLTSWESQAKADKLGIPPQGNWEFKASRKQSLPGNADEIHWETLLESAVELDGKVAGPHRSVTELTLGKPAGAPMEIAGVRPITGSPTHPHDTIGAIKGQKVNQKQEEKPIFFLQSFSSALYWKG